MRLCGVLYLAFAALFAGLGVFQGTRRDKPAHFWANLPDTPAAKITNIPAYNRGHGLLWLGFAALIAAYGAAAFAVGDGPNAKTAAALWGLTQVFVLFGGVIGLILGHLQLERKYRKK